MDTLDTEATIKSHILFTSNDVLDVLDAQENLGGPRLGIGGLNAPSKSSFDLEDRPSSANTTPESHPAALLAQDIASQSTPTTSLSPSSTSFTTTSSPNPENQSHLKFTNNARAYTMSRQPTPGYSFHGAHASNRLPFGPSTSNPRVPPQQQAGPGGPGAMREEMDLPRTTQIPKRINSSDWRMRSNTEGAVATHGVGAGLGAGVDFHGHGEGQGQSGGYYDSSVSNAVEIPSASSGDMSAGGDEYSLVQYQPDYGAGAGSFPSFGFPHVGGGGAAGGIGGHGGGSGNAARGGGSMGDYLLERSYAYCYDRGRGQYTRLIPADMLPDLKGIPKTQDGHDGMIILQPPQMSPPSGVNANTEPVSLTNPDDPVQAAIDNIINTAPPASQRRPKIYCDKWVHEGVCAFTQQGCKYKHEMPRDRATQNNLGLFHGLPHWWKKREAELQRNKEPQSAEPSSPGDIERELEQARAQAQVQEGGHLHHLGHGAHSGARHFRGQLYGSKQVMQGGQGQQVPRERASPPYPRFMPLPMRMRADEDEYTNEYNDQQSQYSDTNGDDLRSPINTATTYPNARYGTQPVRSPMPTPTMSNPSTGFSRGNIMPITTPGIRQLRPLHTPSVSVGQNDVLTGGGQGRSVFQAGSGPTTPVSPWGPIGRPRREDEFFRGFGRGQIGSGYSNVRQDQFEGGRFNNNFGMLRLDESGDERVTERRGT